MPIARSDEELFEGSVVRRLLDEDTVWFQIPEKFAEVLKSGCYKATVEAGYLAVKPAEVTEFNKEN